MTTIALALIAAVAPTLTVIFSYLLARRQRSTLADQASNKLDTIHVLVNSRLSEALDRIKHLEQALNIRPGEPIPPKEK